MFSFSREGLYKFIVVSFFLLFSIKYISGLPQILYVVPLLGMSAFILLYGKLKEYKVLAPFIFWFTFFFMMSLLSSSENEFRSVYYLGIGATAFFVGFVFYWHKKFAYYFSLFTLILFNFFILTNVFLSTEPSFVVLNDVFPGSSRNIVGAMAIFLQIFYSASYYRVKQKLPYLLLFFTGTIVFLAFGRSSIIGFILILFAYYVHVLKIYSIYSFLLFIPLAFYLFDYYGVYENLEFFLSDYTNFDKGLDSPRLSILSEYWATTSFINFWSGHPLSDSLTTQYLGGNPHNSLIRNHSYYGYVGLLFLLFLFFYTVLKVKKETMIYFAFTMVYFFRSNFEPIAFFDIYDFLFFYLFFLVIFYRRDRFNARVG